MSVVLVAIAPAFGLTQLIVNRYRDERQRLAQVWTARGRDELAARPAPAVTDFETALSYGAEGATVRFFLARALMAAKRPAEARAQLATLAAEDPGNSDVNLELARIASARGDMDEAVRYYHAAADGVWSRNAVTSRRETRIELARLLMSDGQDVRAQAELIALLDDLPADANLITDVGSLLMNAGARDRALTLFRRALDLDESNGRASRLAGEAEFQKGDIRIARRDLARARANGALDEQARDMLDVSARVVTLDPYVDRLALRTRAARALRGLAVAKARVERCRSAWTADERIAPKLMELSSSLDATVKISAATLERDADRIDELMALSFEVEKLPSGPCGADSPDDRALSIIASQHSTQPQ